MQTKNILSSLKKWLAYRKAFQIILNLFEAGIVVLIGVSSNQIDNEFWKWILITLCGVYFILLLVKSIDLYHFPSSLADHLATSIENDDLKFKLNEVNIQNEVIIEMIDTLNNQTCIIESHSHTNDSGSLNHFCDLGIAQGLSELFEPLINNYYRIFSSASGGFLIAIYLEEINEIHNNELNENLTGFVILSDSLALKESLNFNSINDADLKGIELEVQSKIKKSFQNGISEVSTLTDKNKNYIMVCSNIAEACDTNSPLGTLVIISNSKENVFTDSMSLLEILNRIASNWISKYNECVIKKYERLLK